MKKVGGHRTNFFSNGLDVTRHAVGLPSSCAAVLCCRKRVVLQRTQCVGGEEFRSGEAFPGSSHIKHKSLQNQKAHWQISDARISTFSDFCWPLEWYKSIENMITRTEVIKITAIKKSKNCTKSWKWSLVLFHAISCVWVLTTQQSTMLTRRHFTLSYSLTKLSIQSADVCQLGVRGACLCSAPRAGRPSTPKVIQGILAQVGACIQAPRSMYTINLNTFPGSRDLFATLFNANS